ncbi:MAG TPA: hypothetical protein V6D17_15000 [Candidatus Obscuribacterales bacterium]
MTATGKPAADTAKDDPKDKPPATGADNEGEGQSEGTKEGDQGGSCKASEEEIWDEFLKELYGPPEAGCETPKPGSTAKPGETAKTGDPAKPGDAPQQTSGEEDWLDLGWLWDEAGIEDPAATPAKPEAQAEKPKEDEQPKEEKKGWFTRVWEGTKDAAGKVADAVTSAATSVKDRLSSALDRIADGLWAKQFSPGADVDISQVDGKSVLTVKEKVKGPDGKEGEQIITSDGTKTTTHRPDGSIVVREGDKTSVTSAKGDYTITRDASGKETVKFKDGRELTIDEAGKLDANFKNFHQEVTKEGVLTTMTDSEGKVHKIMQTTKNLSEIPRDMWRQFRNIDGRDFSKRTLDSETEHDISAIILKDKKMAVIKREGDKHAVAVSVENGKEVYHLVDVDERGKPTGKPKRVEKLEDLPQWFREHAEREAQKKGRHCHHLEDLRSATGLTATADGGLTLQQGAMKTQMEKDGDIRTEVKQGDGENQKIVVTNDRSGEQKVEDLATGQGSTWDGKNWKMTQDGKVETTYDPEERHLQSDKYGFDSTAQGTRFANGDFLGSDGSYTTSSGTKYFDSTYASPQQVNATATGAIASSIGAIDSVKAQLGAKGISHVDTGSLETAYGSLANALALCIKTGNFDKLSMILSQMNAVQQCLAEGLAFNANRQIEKAALPGATDEELATHESHSTPTAVVQAVRQEMEQRRSA